MEASPELMYEAIHAYLLIRFHGVLAPNAKLRCEVVPGGPFTINDTTDELDGLRFSKIVSILGTPKRKIRT